MAEPGFSHLKFRSSYIGQKINTINTMVKRILISLLFLLLVSSAYSQSAFRVIRIARNAKVFRPSVICREIRVPRTQGYLANQLIAAHNPNSVIRQANKHCVPEIIITAEYNIPLLRMPETLYGGYNNLKTIAGIAKNPTAVDKRYIRIWKHINNSTTYNGVHHIVNKSTLKAIHLEQVKSTRKNINLAAMQNNAPAIFHIYHGNQAYKDVFHNSEAQLDLYHQKGIKGVIQAFFAQLNYINAHGPLKLSPVSKEVIKGTMLEAEIWAKTFGLRWE